MKKYTLQDVADIVQSEGLGYAIHSYLSHDRIEDEELAKLWRDCSDLMDKIKAKLENYLE